jgi:hypothetical protein
MFILIFYIYRRYSQSGCVFECRLQYGRSILEGAGCTPWFYPSLGTSIYFLVILCTCIYREVLRLTLGRALFAFFNLWITTQMAA